MTENPNLSVPARNRGWRFAAIFFSILIAFAVAWFSRKPGDVETSAPIALQPAGPSPAEILNGIQIPDSKTDTDKALATIIDKVRAAPGKADDWVILGDTLAQKLRDTSDQTYYAHAESAYLQALKLDSRDANAMTGMAWVTGGLHVFDQSIGWADKALAIEPGHVAATGILGDTALELGDYDKAFEHYQKMTDLRPDLSSWSRGAYLLWLTGDKKKGIWLMEKAIKAGAPFAENSAWCRARLAMMYFHDGALLPAEQILLPALAKDSRNPHVLLAAARISAAKMDYPTALAFCGKLLEDGPNHEALVLSGDCHAAAGDSAKAEAYYQKVEDLHTAQETKGAHDHMLMARFYADHDRNLVTALRMAEEHKLTKNVLEADVLAWVYFKNGNLPRAEEVIKLAMSQNTPETDMHYHAGMIAAAAGHKQTAKKHLQQALAQNAQFNPVQAPIARKALEETVTASNAPRQ